MQTNGPQGTTQQDEGDELNLGALLSILLGRKLLITAALGLGLFVSFIHVLSQPRIYSADALIQLEEKTAGLPGLDDLNFLSEEPKTAAEIEILLSRMVLSEVVDSLDLTLQTEPTPLPYVRRLYEVIPSPVAVALQSTMPFLRPYNWGDTAIEVGRYTLANADGSNLIVVTKLTEQSFDVALPDGRHLEGALGQLIKDDSTGIELLIARLDGPIGRSFRVWRSSKISAIQSLQGRLSVAERGRGTAILTVSLRAESPAKAQSTLNAVTEAFLRQNVSRTSAEVEQSLTFVDEQLPLAKARADAAQAALNTYMKVQDAVNLEQESSRLLDRITELEAELSVIGFDEERLSRRYLRDHPLYQELLLKKNQVLRELDGMRSKAEQLPEAQKEIFNLRQTVEITQEIYRQFLNRSQELGIARASTVGNVRIIDTAIASSTPVEPRARRVVALGAIAGLAIGIALALLWFYFRRTIDTLADLEKVGLPLYGVVGQIPGLPTSRLKRGERLTRLIMTDGNDAAKEAFRSIRTSLHFGLFDTSPKAIAITSSAPGEGKSFISYNIAEVLAVSGLKTCLVDTDMRRGYLHRVFGLPEGKMGLSEYLAGDIEADGVISTIAGSNLAVISAGRVPPNPSELLMSPRFPQLVKLLDSYFDVIIFDTAPVLAVTDPMIVFRSVSMRLGVVRHGKTELGALAALKEICARENSPLDGIIMNGFDERHARSYGYGYGYGYGYNYGYRNNQGYAGAYSYSATESDHIGSTPNTNGEANSFIAPIADRPKRGRLAWMFKSRRNGL